MLEGTATKAIDPSPMVKDRRRLAFWLLNRHYPLLLRNHKRDMEQEVEIFLIECKETAFRPLESQLRRHFYRVAKMYGYSNYRPSEPLDRRWFRWDCFSMEDALEPGAPPTRECAGLRMHKPEREPSVLAHPELLDLDIALKRLPFRARQVTVMVNLMGYTEREAAKMLGLQPGAVAATMAFAKKRLRQMMNA